MLKRSLSYLTLGFMGACSLPLLFTQTVEAAPQQVRHYCQRQESVFLAVETRNFWVSICGGDLPNSYVGVNKKTRKSIRLPLSSSDPQGRYFEAVNGQYTYILAESTKGKNLTVSRGTRELLREPVIRGW